MNERPQPLVGTNDWKAPDTFKTPDPKARVFDLIGLTEPDGPKFEDDVWDLSPLPGWPAGYPKNKLVLFDEVPSPWRDLAKVTCLFQFAPTVAGAHLDIDPRRLAQFDGGNKPATIQNFLKVFVPAANAALHAGKDNAGRFAGVDDWRRCALLLRHGKQAAFEGQVSGNPLAADTAVMRARTLLLIDRVAQVCGWERPFGSVPFEGAKVDSFFYEAGQIRDPFNKVRPNPEVLTATAIAAFFFESGIAKNIVDAAEWWATRPAPADPERAIADLVADLIEKRGALPGNLHHLSTGGIAWQALAASVGFRDEVPEQMRHRIAAKVRDAMGWDGGGVAALRQMQTAPMALCEVEPIAVRSRIDDVERPWCHPTEFNLTQSLDWLVTAVSMLAVVLLHGTTAMRPKDRHFLDVDCVEQFTDTDGVERYRLNGWKTKGEAVPQPIHFPIPPLLANALNLVKRLHGVLGVKAGVIRGLADHGIAGKHHLFARDLHRWMNRKGDRKGEVLNTKDNLDGWANGVHARLVEAKLVKPMEPLGHITHRQMRITVSQAHYRHEYGPALAANLGAWSSERVEFGYIGDVRRRPMIAAESLNAFVDADSEKQREQRDAERGFMLLDLAARFDELNDAGQRRMTDITIRHRENLNVANLTMLSERQVMQALAAVGSEEQLGVTPLVACVYNPARALCDGSGYANPQDCRPAACANAIQTREMRAAYELERRALQGVVDENPRSIFKPRLDQLTEDGEHIIAEFAEFTADDLHDLIVKGSMVGRAVPVDITPKEES